MKKKGKKEESREGKPAIKVILTFSPSRSWTRQDKNSNYVYMHGFKVMSKCVFSCNPYGLQFLKKVPNYSHIKINAST